MCESLEFANDRRRSDPAIESAARAPLLESNPWGLFVVVRNILGDPFAFDVHGRSASITLTHRSERHTHAATCTPDDADGSNINWLHLLGSAPAGVAVWRCDRQLLLLNHAGRAILGLAQDGDASTLSDVDCRYVDGTPIPRELRPHERVFRGECFDHYEVIVTLPNGVARRLVCCGACATDPRGDLSLAMVTFRDVTNARDVERARDEYADIVCDELRSPLEVLRHCAGLAKQFAQHLGSIDPRDTLARIQCGVDRVHALIGELRDALRFGSRNDFRDRRWVDLSRLVDTVIEGFDDASRRRIAFVRNADACVLAANPVQLARAIVHVVSNCLETSPPTASIIVSLARRNGVAILGVACDPSERERPNDRSRPDGSEHIARDGCSSDLARAIVETHGGRIVARSVPGAGSAFRVVLPVVANARP